jgi:BASS family bile acid:Na+ symporter
VARVASSFVLASAAALLLLNYIKSAQAMPHVRESTMALLLVATVLAAALSVVGIVLGWALAWATRVKPPTRAALMFGLSMKHTGLALILAGAVLKNQPLAILVIVLATLLQHVLAGVVQWWIERHEAMT